MKNNSPFLINLHELPRRAGEMRQYHFSFPLPERMGTPMLGIESGIPMTIDLRAESVDDGILITGNITSAATGECGRCLDSVGVEINQEFRELFLYQSRTSEDPDQDEGLFVLSGDEADIETAVRDAVILTMPLNPLCDEECPGLCSECGEKWSTLPEGHSHEVIDPRWKGLTDWKPE
jgi:uncharacterized protein